MAMHECAQNHPQWSCLVKGRMRDLNSKAEEEEELMPKGSTYDCWRRGRNSRKMQHRLRHCRDVLCEASHNYD